MKVEAILKTPQFPRNDPGRRASTDGTNDKDEEMAEEEGRCGGGDVRKSIARLLKCLTTYKASRWGVITAMMAPN